MLDKYETGPLSDAEIDEALGVREKQLAKGDYAGSFDSVRELTLVDPWRLLATVEALRKMIRERDAPLCGHTGCVESFCAVAMAGEVSADYEIRRRVHELTDSLIDEEVDVLDRPRRTQGILPARLGPYDPGGIREHARQDHGTGH